MTPLFFWRVGVRMLFRQTILFHPGLVQTIFLVDHCAATNFVFNNDFHTKVQSLMGKLSSD